MFKIVDISLSGIEIGLPLGFFIEELISVNFFSNTFCSFSISFNVFLRSSISPSSASFSVGFSSILLLINA